MRNYMAHNGRIFEMRKFLRSIFWVTLLFGNFVLAESLDDGTYVIKNIEEKTVGGTGGTKNPVSWLYTPEAFFAQEDIFIEVLGRKIKT
jgi:hypothetical protein